MLVYGHCGLDLGLKRQCDWRAQGAAAAAKVNLGARCAQQVRQARCRPAAGMACRPAAGMACRPAAGMACPKQGPSTAAVARDTHSQLGRRMEARCQVAAGSTGVIARSWAGLQAGCYLPSPILHMQLGACALPIDAPSRQHVAALNGPPPTGHCPMPPVSPCHAAHTGPRSSRRLTAPVPTQPQGSHPTAAVANHAPVTCCSGAASVCRSSRRRGPGAHRCDQTQAREAVAAPVAAASTVLGEGAGGARHAALGLSQSERSRFRV